MAVIPKEVQELEACAMLISGLRDEDFPQVVVDVDLPHRDEAFIPGVREMSEQGVLFVIVACEELLDESLVVSNHCASKQGLLSAALAKPSHVVQPALVGLLCDSLALLLAADNVQCSVAHKVGHFHDDQQVEAAAHFVVDGAEGGRLGPQPLNCLQPSLPLFNLFQRHSMQLVAVCGHHKAIALSLAVWTSAKLTVIQYLQPLDFARLHFNVLQFVYQILPLKRLKYLFLSCKS